MIHASSIDDTATVPPSLVTCDAALPSTAIRAGRAPSLIDDLELVSWGFNGDVTDAARARWTSDHVVLMLRRDVRAVDVGVRSPSASPRHTIRVSVRTNASRQ